MLSFNSAAPICRGVRLLPWRSPTCSDSSCILLIWCPEMKTARDVKSTALLDVCRFSHEEPSRLQSSWTLIWTLFGPHLAHEMAVCTLTTDQKRFPPPTQRAHITVTSLIFNFHAWTPENGRDFYLFIFFVASCPKHEILMADVAVATVNGCLANLRMAAFRMTFIHVKI